MSKLKELPSNKALILNNNICVYCGSMLFSNYTKEHVIARKFVPKGTLDKNWNLILAACSRCNGLKSELENDISAITLRACLIYDELKNDPDFVGSFESKGRAISRKTKKPVSVSQEKLSTNVQHGSSLNFKFGFEAPPQIDEDRAFQLALFQVRAFFYAITFNDETQNGKWWEGEFVPVGLCHRADWGNERQISFMKNVHDWKTQWIGITAKGFYKSIIKKHPEERCWSWALEWNSTYRLIGFFGDVSIISLMQSNLKKLKVSRLDLPDGQFLLQRMDMPLSEAYDILFSTGDLN